MNPALRRALLVVAPAAVLFALALAFPPAPAAAQDIGFSGSGPIEILADEAIEWRQAEKIVIARGNARATRNNVTVFADRLIARYRSRQADGSAPSAAAPANDPLGGGANEIWRLEAEGHVRIVSAADTAEADRAIYDLDQSVLVLTGQALRIRAGSDEVRARDSLEYWSRRRMAVARGDASVTSADRRLEAAVLVAYMAPPPPEGAARPAPAAAQRIAAGREGGASAPLSGALGGQGRIERVEAYDDVVVRTPAENVRGDRGVYVPATGIVQVTGAVRITRGQNQLNGAFAEINLRTGVARLMATAPGAGSTGGRVSGLVVPGEQPQPGQERQR